MMKLNKAALATTLLLGTNASKSDYCQVNEHSIDVSKLPFALDGGKGLHPCQYSGTVVTSDDAALDSHLFYWFFKNENPDAHTVVWLNGGPGATSMFGLFLENGPLRVKEPKDGEFVLYAAERSWADDYNLIFLDQPVNTGFSFGKKSLDSMQVGSEQFIRFLEEFYKIFPELAEAPLHLTGESYAGKYLPLFTHDILESNKKGATKIPLATTLIIDPYPAPVVQRTSMHQVPSALGIIDENNLKQISVLEQRCQRDHTFDILKARDTCSGIMDYIQAVSGDVLNYNTRIFEYDWDPIESPYVNYLTNHSRIDELYSAIHISDSYKTPVFAPGSESVAEGYQSDNLVDYSWYYDYLIGADYPFVVSSGEFDMQDGAISQYTWMKALLTKVGSEFWSQDRKIFYYPGQDGGMKVGGYFQHRGNFTVMSVPKSGHFIPADNYGASIAILNDLVNHQQLLCHNSDAGCSVTSEMCKAMNDCSGHGQCGGNGQCTCQPGFKGADCSYEVLQQNENAKVESKGAMWYYYQHDFAKSLPSKNAWEVSISSSSPFSVFLSYGAESNPNRFEYDVMYKNVKKSLTLTSQNLPVTEEDASGFVVAIEVHSFDIADNKAIPFTLEVSPAKGAAETNVLEQASFLKAQLIREQI